MTNYFDPLNYENLGMSIAIALENQPVQSLVDLEKFDGAGIYALYYTGKYPAYEPLSRVNRKRMGSWAIYIGKAEAENARKGDSTQLYKAGGSKLYSRISNHVKSIGYTNNLDIRDFQFRALTVMPTWIPLAEIVAIRLHQPVWNSIVDGFGNHDPGKGRYRATRPRWDTLHPGRPWAERLEKRSESPENITQDVVTHLLTFPPAKID